MEKVTLCVGTVVISSRSAAHTKTIIAGRQSPAVASTAPRRTGLVGLRVGGLSAFRILHELTHAAVLDVLLRRRQRVPVVAVLSALKTLATRLF